MNPVPIIHFPKICPKHRRPMAWEPWKLARLDEGWLCSQCRGNCPIHGFPLRPMKKGAYCRKCVRAKITAESRETNHMNSKDGVAIILRRGASRTPAPDRTPEPRAPNS